MRETIEEDMEERRKFKRRTKITAGKILVGGDEQGDMM